MTKPVTETPTKPATRTRKGPVQVAVKAPEPKPRGLAALSPKRRREIAAMGGRSAHAAGVANRFTPEAAKRAGKKGGKSISKNRKYMAEIGRKGGAS